MGPEVARRVLLFALLAAAAAVAVPFAPWLIVGVWIGLALRPLAAPMVAIAGGRHRAAAAVTVACLLAVVAPVVAILFPLGREAMLLVRRLASPSSGTTAFELLVTPSGATAAPADPDAWMGLVRDHGGAAWGVISSAAAVATDVLLGLLLLVLTTYHTLAEGSRTWQWLVENAPLKSSDVDRLGAAFVETGRGLFVGIGGAGLAQAAVATAAYVALGVPRAVVLGLLTLFVSIIPSIGTALVWVPVAIGLATQGRPAAAVVLAIIGLLVVGTIDNVLRPTLARRGHLALPSLVVLTSMLGGFSLIGGWGLLLGPLVIRLAKESIDIARDERKNA
jgi:predicted PurR-regulated permease PerM